MFERFTHQARRVVTEAQREARDLHHGNIGTEHLLLGLLLEERGVGARVLTGLGLDHDTARAAVVRAVGRDLPQEPDAAALETIGIDLDEVRRRVEATFGSGALGRRRRGCRTEAKPGFVPLTPRAKKVLELALRQAISLGHNYIGTEHILLGLLTEGKGLAARVLAEAGIRLDEVRNWVLEEVERSADYG